MLLRLLYKKKRIEYTYTTVRSQRHIGNTYTSVITKHTEQMVHKYWAHSADQTNYVFLGKYNIETTAADLYALG